MCGNPLHPLLFLVSHLWLWCEIALNSGIEQDNGPVQLIIVLIMTADVQS